MRLSESPREGVFVKELERCLLVFFQAEDGIRDLTVTGVQTCALPIPGDPPATLLLSRRSRGDIVRRQHRRNPDSLRLGKLRGKAEIEHVASVVAVEKQDAEIGRASCRERV